MKVTQMTDNEEPMDNPFSFFGPVPIPPEMQAEIEEQRNRQLMAVQAEDTDRRHFIESLSVPDLLILKGLIRMVGMNPSAGEYLAGWIGSMITYKHKRCGGCGEDHLGALLDDHDAPEVEVGMRSDVKHPVAPDYDDDIVDEEQLRKLELMDKYNVKPAGHGDETGVTCKGCGKWYPSLEDRMLKDPDDCPNCIIKTKWGGS